uniref:Uncharacterized protein n=1 Tax=Strigamia maritima TaxID=126957 RepID=T1JLD1_STRMM
MAANQIMSISQWIKQRLDFLLNVCTITTEPIEACLNEISGKPKKHSIQGIRRMVVHENFDDWQWRQSVLITVLNQSIN